MDKWAGIINILNLVHSGQFSPDDGICDLVSDFDIPPETVTNLYRHWLAPPPPQNVVYDSLEWWANVGKSDLKKQYERWYQESQRETDSTPEQCFHEWETYIGFSNTYQYCEKCGEKIWRYLEIKIKLHYEPRIVAEFKTLNTEWFAAAGPTNANRIIGLMLNKEETKAVQSKETEEE